MKARPSTRGAASSCAVVALALAGNNLVGEVPSDLFVLAAGGGGHHRGRRRQVEEVVLLQVRARRDPILRRSPRPVATSRATRIPTAVADRDR